MQGLLMLRYRTGPLSLQPYSIGQSKSQDMGPGIIQDMVQRTLTLHGRREESHLQTAWIQGGRNNGDHFSINLPMTLLLFQFCFMPKILFLGTMLWKTSFSYKVIMAQSKYWSLSSKPSFHGLLLTTSTRPFWCQAFIWLFPMVAFSSNCAPHAYLDSNKTEWAGSKDLLQHSSSIYSLSFSHALHCPFYH